MLLSVPFTENFGIHFQILSPFLLRRMKKDVDMQLPLKREILVYAHMTELQLTLYKATLDRDYSVFKEQVSYFGKKLHWTKTSLSSRNRCVISAKSPPGQRLLFLQGTGVLFWQKVMLDKDFSVFKEQVCYFGKKPT
jgi:SNF2 family DNA or RNA helicase